MFSKPKISALLVALFLTCFPHGAVAQFTNPADQQIFDTDIQQQDAARGRAENESRNRVRQQRTDTDSNAPTHDPFTVPQGGPCFTLNTVNITGHEPFGRLPEGYTHLIGTCATAADIVDALNRINFYYQAKGFITTRAFLPEQDIADGSLDIQIIAGRIEGYVYSDGRQADRKIKAAFPGRRGALLNLRNLEQGLDNINAPRSASGRFQLIPGENPGGTFVQVFTQNSRRFHVSADVKNTGFETTGTRRATLGFGIDNVLGISDQVQFNVTTTPFDSRTERLSETASLSFTAPYKKWLFGINAGTSRYSYTLAGITRSFPIAGRSRYLIISADRLLMRNQTSKLYAFSDLKLNRSRTFVDSVEVATQRQNFTIGSLGLRGEKNFAVGRLNWEIEGKQGLDAFGASVVAGSVINPNFKLVKTRLSYDHPIGKTNFRYRSVLEGQYSNDILPGTEQFSVGGWSNVRGFHEDNIFGDSGVYLQNTLIWDVYRGDIFGLQFNTGLDYGYIAPLATRFWSQDYLIGATIGAKLDVRNMFTVDLRVARALSRPDDDPPNANPAFEEPRTVYYFGLTAKF